jgi:hypothetical protein
MPSRATFAVRGDYIDFMVSVVGEAISENPYAFSMNAIIVGDQNLQKSTPWKSQVAKKALYTWNLSFGLAILRGEE